MRLSLPSLLLIPLSLAAQPAALTVVSAANGAAVITPKSLASAYGTSLTGESGKAASLPLPVTLSGLEVQVIDTAGVMRLSGILYASPTQINFVTPSDMAIGTATVRVVNSAGVLAQGTVPVQQVAPAFFTVNSARLAAAVAVREIAPRGPVSSFPAFGCDSAGNCTAVPLNVGVDTPTYLELFGTGFRHRSGLANVTVTIGGQTVPALYAGPQNFIPGLDQLNVPLPLSLRGAGMAPILVTVDGQRANTIYVLIQ